ncbi:hypothetical protein [Brucella cytisi]|nr:hypothetical protein [Brucella cytisi]
MADNSIALPVAVLGTGIIGAAVARNLARKGFCGSSMEPFG